MKATHQALEFLRFELRQQIRQPATWISFVACIAAGIAFITTGLGDLDVAAGRVAKNVPYAVLQNLTGLSALGMFVVMISVAQAALKDFKYGTAPLIFSRPVRTSSYLLGRLSGGVFIGVLAVLGGAIAMAVTHWILAQTDSQMAPFSIAAWSFGVMFLVIPNLLLIGTLVNLLALASRSMGITFLGLLVLIIGQDLAEIIPVATFGYRLPALLDPLGIAAMNSVTHSWTVSDYALNFPGLSGDLLLNRVVWGLLTVGFCLLSAPVFAYRARRADTGKKSKRQLRPPQPASVVTRMPDVQAEFGLKTWLGQFWSILKLELRLMYSSLAWRILVVLGIILAGYVAMQGEPIAGVESIPGGRAVATGIDRAAKFTMTIMVLLFSGELVWRERETRMGLTIDTLPQSKGVMVGAKIAALATLIFTSLGAYGIAATAAVSGQFEVAVLPSAAIVPIIHEGLGYLQLAAVYLLLQTLAGGRMRGYLVIALFLALRLGLNLTGHLGPLYSMASANLPFYSDMNEWGHGLQRVALIHAYWTFIALGLAIGAGLLWPHGVVLSTGQSWARAKRRCQGWARIGLLASVVASISAGIWIYQATLASGKGWNRKQTEAFLANYELEYSSWQSKPRPEMTSMMADVDLQPGERQVRIYGRYLLHNHHAQPIAEMLFGYDPDFNLIGLDLVEETNSVLFHQQVLGSKDGQRLFASLPNFLAADSVGTKVIPFDPPLVPGARVYLDFELELDSSGLGTHLSDRWFVENGLFVLAGTGTHPFFLGAQFSPSLGYDPARELRSRKARKRYGLQPWAPLISAEAYEARRADENRVNQTDDVFGGSDWANVELWIHTPADQTALAPGDLLQRTVNNGRAEHHFRTSDRIQAFFPILSGRYLKQVDRQGSVDLELYYHSAHEARVAHIMWAMKRSLAYFEEHWGPYPHKVLRLGEVPGEASFAASFPAIMGFGEGNSFTSPHGDGETLSFQEPDSEESSATDLDPVLWIVAHEVAHQWWDADVLPGLAMGASLVSETLAQYGSLCVVQAEYGDDVSLRLAQYNRKSYLRERSRAPRAERPLVDVDDQAHLHYNKGMVAFHALAEVAGYQAIDRALAQIVREFRGPDGRPITSVNLMQALQQHLPPEAMQLADEHLRQIAFVESVVQSANAVDVGNGGFQLSVDCEISATQADGDGAEQGFDYQGSMELKVYYDGKPAQRLSAEVHAGRVHFENLCPQLPIRVQLDPRMLHMERNLRDNERNVTEIDS